MRHLLVFFTLTAVIFAQEPVTLYGGQVLFELPRGLFSITPSAIKEGYLEARYPPQHVYKNQTGDVSIAFNHMQNKPVTAAGLDAFRDQLEADFKSKWKELTWVSTSTILLNGVRWFQLEFISRDQAYPVHNWVLGTPFKGSLLMVTLHAFDDFDPVMTNALLNTKVTLRLITQ